MLIKKLGIFIITMFVLNSCWLTKNDTVHWPTTLTINNNSSYDVGVYVDNNFLTFISPGNNFSDKFPSGNNYSIMYDFYSLNYKLSEIISIELNEDYIFNIQEPNPSVTIVPDTNTPIPTPIDDTPSLKTKSFDTGNWILTAGWDHNRIGYSGMPLYFFEFAENPKIINLEIDNFDTEMLIKYEFEFYDDNGNVAESLYRYDITFTNNTASILLNSGYPSQTFCWYKDGKWNGKCTNFDAVGVNRGRLKIFYLQ